MPPSSSMAGVAHLLEFAGWLSTNGCGAQGSALFVNAAPEGDSTGPQLFLIEIPSPAPHVLQSTSFIRRPKFRIDVRSTAPGAQQQDYPNVVPARNLAQRAYNACLAVGGSQLASTAAGSTGNWLFAIPESEPYLAARDTKNRVVFSFAVGCERQGP